MSSKLDLLLAHRLFLPLGTFTQILVRALRSVGINIILSANCLLANYQLSAAELSPQICIDLPENVTSAESHAYISSAAQYSFLQKIVRDYFLNNNGL